MNLRDLPQNAQRLSRHHSLRQGCLPSNNRSLRAGVGRCLHLPVNSEFPNGLGNIRVTGLQLSVGLPNKHQLLFDPNTRPRIIGFPFTGSRWCLLCLGFSHHIKISCRSRNGDPLRTLDQALSRTIGSVCLFPCPGWVQGIKCSSLLWISRHCQTVARESKEFDLLLTEFKSASFCWLPCCVGIQTLFHLATVRIALLLPESVLYKLCSHEEQKCLPASWRSAFLSTL
jgi:hypothetical protein